MAHPARLDRHDRLAGPGVGTTICSTETGSPLPRATTPRTLLATGPPRLVATIRQDHVGRRRERPPTAGAAAAVSTQPAHVRSRWGRKTGGAVASHAEGDRLALNRRQFLRRAGGATALLGTAAVLGPLAAGCGSDRGGTATTTSAPPPPTSVTTSTTTGPPAWSVLAASLAGSLVLPTDPNFGVDKELYNERFDDLAPTAIAYCATPADVQRCLDFARAPRVAAGRPVRGPQLRRLLLVRRAGDRRHPDGRPSAVARRHHGDGGAGARLIDVYAPSAGRRAPARRVLPDGGHRRADPGRRHRGRSAATTGSPATTSPRSTWSPPTAACSPPTPEQNADLFWACRGGGGGNFGVVTSFTFARPPHPADSPSSPCLALGGGGRRARRVAAVDAPHAPTSCGRTASSSRPERPAGPTPSG